MQQTRRPSRALFYNVLVYNVLVDNALEALLIALCVSASGYGLALLESLPLL